MSDMRKINEEERNKKIGESDIYRKFSEQFDKMFDADETAQSDEEFDEMYVHDYDFESQLERFKETETNMAKFCVGYTGIGKTTGIRYCLGLGIGDEAKFNSSGKIIVFPTFLDGYQSDDIKKFDFSARIAAVSTALKKKHPELKTLLKTKEGKEELYDFISRHTSFALENTIDPVDEMDMEEHEVIRKKLQGANKKIHLSFKQIY